MTNDILTEHKLILLYFLGSVNSSLSSTEVSNFMLEKNYTDYFQVQQYLSDLKDANMIDLYKNENKLLYKINDKGRETLEFFSTRLSPKNKSIVDEYMEDFTALSNSELITTFDYVQTETNDYNIKCSLIRNSKKFIDISLNDINKSNFENIKKNWDNNKLSIYKYLKENLVNNE